MSAAYALDALGPHDAAVFEEHLSGCPRCRADLASFRGAAGQLALAASVAVAPPPALRERILTQARAERGNVVPFRRRWALPAAATVAAAAASVAVGLGIWAASLSSQLDEERTARAQDDRALAVAFDPGAAHYRIEGGDGVLAVADGGRGALILRGLGPAPDGKVYEAWVSADGEEMLPAGTFEAHGGRTVFLLSRPVPEGGLVAVTLERDGGVERPTGDPLLVAETA